MCVCVCLSCFSAYIVSLRKRPNFMQIIFNKIYIIHRTKLLLNYVFMLQANDPDLDDIVRYRIDADRITANGDYLENVESTAFILEENTGVVRLNFDVLPAMKGFFEFKIVAYDLGKFRWRQDISTYYKRTSKTRRKQSN